MRRKGVCYDVGRELEGRSWRPDFDLASYSLVKSFGSRLGDLAEEFPEVPWDTTEHGATYPDMPWEPKDSFRAVAAWNAVH